MNRSDLLTLAQTSTDIKAALRAYFATEEGQRELSSYPLITHTGLPRPWTEDEAIAALVEEARAMSDQETT